MCVEAILSEGVRLDLGGVYRVGIGAWMEQGQGEETQI